MERNTPLEEMNDRSRDIFRRLVESYLGTGEPVGSRTLARSLAGSLSPATIRNVMQDLEYLGLLSSPHVSAGRMPTQLGLRLFVDAFLEMNQLDPGEMKALDPGPDADSGIGAILDRAGAALSQMTKSASLVLAPKHDAPIRHVEFVSLGPERAIAVLVMGDGHVENRVFTPPPGQTPSSLREAANFVNALAEGKTVGELRRAVEDEISHRRLELDASARVMVENGTAIWAGSDSAQKRLIVRGQANLLADGAAAEDLERVRGLFEELERKQDIAEFLQLTEDGEGVRIFIGSENKLFSLSGSSLVVSPYMNADRKIMGAVGVIGPTRLNYGRIVPIVEYSAQIVGKAISGKDQGQGR